MGISQEVPTDRPTTAGESTTTRRHRHGHRHRSRRQHRILAGAVVVLSATILSACWSANQDKDLGFINQSRRQNGKAVVNGDSELMRKAQAWAEHMAATGKLEHSGRNGTIDTGGITNWCAVGENVGYAGSTWDTHQAFMASANHKSNVLGNYDRVGTGVVRKGDVVWVVELYVKSC